MLLDGTPTGLEPYVASIKSLFFTTCCFNVASCPSGRLLLTNFLNINIKDMTRQEFIDRTGFIPTEDQFKTIRVMFLSDAIREGVAPDSYAEPWCAAWCQYAKGSPIKAQLEKMERDRELRTLEQDRRKKDCIIDSKDVVISLLRDRVKQLEASKAGHEEADSEGRNVTLDEIDAAVAMCNL